MKAISVIIPCFNCAAEIEACVRAVLAGTYKPLEIVLVDDCSTDGTFAVLESLSRKLPDKVRAIRTEKNGGPARTRNAGAKVARGDYFFFLDSDTEILPDSLAHFAERINDCDAVVGIYDEEPINPSPSPRYKAMLYAYILGEWGVRPYDQFSASCAGIRADVFRNVGGYDESFPPGLDFENEEFGVRVAKTYKMVLDPALRTRHRFPTFRKMTRTFFQRTALWVEMFMVRRTFSTVATTSSTGLGSMALLAAAAMLPLAMLHRSALILSGGAYLWYLYAYSGFLRFVARRRPSFLPGAFVLNHYYTLVVALGAVFGVLRTITGTSRVRKKFMSLPSEPARHRATPDRYS